ncbi:hypothetical protein CK203_041149 [Vitis vinifera]|uniref:DUF4283 domain-containing protein n=1 Tax=Vitis vinifera TaxID=29760 RepID=A0A438HT59_VITVI|nr:hypothetical protein CK203_041149 [Vitis vinifera]
MGLSGFLRECMTLSPKVERDALWEEFGAIRGLWEDPWGENLLGMRAKIIRLGQDWTVGVGIRRGPTPFRFENMWLKVEGFKDLVHSWWQGIELECNKSLALQQVEFWDRKESERILTVEETELKKEAKENYRKWINGEWLLEEQEIRKGIANAFQNMLSEDMGWKADIGRLQFDQISQQEAENLESPLQRMKSMWL